MKKLLNDIGDKARQRSDNEDRAIQYREWHRTAKQCYMTDVDSVEWMFHKNEQVDIAVIPFGHLKEEDFKYVPQNGILERSEILQELNHLFYLSGDEDILAQVELLIFIVCPVDV